MQGAAGARLRNAGPGRQRAADALGKWAWHRGCRPGGQVIPMDLVLVAATVAFFAVSLAYVRGCDRL